MKNIIVIAVVSIFSVSVYAQEAPQAHRTQGQHDVTEIGENQPAPAEKVEISPAEVPSEVMNSFEQSEYADADIITAYKVSEAKNTPDLSNTPLTYEESEDTLSEAEAMTNETETVEDMETTGQVVSAEAPEAETEDIDDEITEEEKELYERNQYGKYTEANSDAYAEIAQEKTQDSETSSRYELQVESNDEKTTLLYSSEGELLKTEKGSM